MWRAVICSRRGSPSIQRSETYCVNGMSSASTFFSTSFNTAYANTVLLTEPASNSVFSSTGPPEVALLTPNPRDHATRPSLTMAIAEPGNAGRCEESRDFRFEPGDQRRRHGRRAPFVWWRAACRQHRQAEQRPAVLDKKPAPPGPVRHGPQSFIPRLGHNGRCTNRELSAGAWRRAPRVSSRRGVTLLASTDCKAIRRLTSVSRDARRHTHYHLPHVVLGAFLVASAVAAVPRWLDRRTMAAMIVVASVLLYTREPSASF